MAMRQFRPHLSLNKLVVGFFSCLAQYAITHPRRTLLLAGLVTLAAAPGLTRLKLRTDGQALVSPNAPEVLYDQKIRHEFGIEDQIVVVIRSPHPDGIFNPGTMQLVRDLTADLAKVPGTNPTNLMSLATEPGFHLRPGTLIHQKLLEPPLKEKAELDQLREDLRRIQLYTGTLVSADGRSTCILVAAGEAEDRTQLYGRIKQLIGAKQQELVGQGAQPISTTNRPPLPGPLPLGGEEGETIAQAAVRGSSPSPPPR